jgi:hypothetical protein
VCNVKNAKPYPVSRHVESHSSKEHKAMVLKAIGYKEEAPLNVVDVLKEPASSLGDFVPPKKRSVQFVLYRECSMFLASS